MPFARTRAHDLSLGLKHVLFTAATPIDDAHSQIVQFCLRSDREEMCRRPTPRLRPEDHRGGPLHPRVDGSRRPARQLGARAHMASDKLGVLMRKRLLALLREHGEEEVRAAS